MILLREPSGARIRRFFGEQALYPSPTLRWGPREKGRRPDTHSTGSWPLGWATSRRQSGCLKRPLPSAAGSATIPASPPCSLSSGRLRGRRGITHAPWS
jgi:hypothetical protein